MGLLANRDTILFEILEVHELLLKHFYCQYNAAIARNIRESQANL